MDDNARKLQASEAARMKQRCQAVLSSAIYKLAEAGGSLESMALRGTAPYTVSAPDLFGTYWIKCQPSSDTSTASSIGVKCLPADNQWLRYEWTPPVKSESVETSSTSS